MTWTVELTGYGFDLVNAATNEREFHGHGRPQARREAERRNAAEQYPAEAVVAVTSFTCDICGAPTQYGCIYCADCARDILDRQRSIQEGEVPHCTSCNDNPATENDSLCLPCAQFRDAQPVRQENAESPFRAGSGPVLSPFARSLNIAREMGFTVRENYAHRRYALLPLAALFALGIGSASATDYTPTAPIGCTITRYWEHDDMSAIAVCAGSYVITKQDGPTDDWDDIPYAIDTLVLTDANGGTHDFPVMD